jgi:hypothetical protein
MHYFGVNVGKQQLISMLPLCWELLPNNHHVINLLETNLILCNCYISARACAHVCVCVCVNILTTYVEKLCYCKTLLNQSSQDQKRGLKLCNFKLSSSLCVHLLVICLDEVLMLSCKLYFTCLSNMKIPFLYLCCKCLLSIVRQFA